MTELSNMERAKARALRQATHTAGRNFLKALKEQGEAMKAQGVDVSKISKARTHAEIAISHATEDDDRG